MMSSSLSVGMFLVLDKFDVFSAADYQLFFFLSKVAKWQIQWPFSL